MKKGKLIAKGKHAEIFMYGAEQVVKLFHNTVSDNHIKREVSNTEIAIKQGVTVPRIKDVIKLDGCVGIVSEFIKGPTVTNILRREPYKIKIYAHEFAKAQVEMHQLSGSGFSDQRKFMQNAISNSKGRLGEIANTILSQFETLSEGRQLCHNDLHQENIIFSKNGPVILDWQEALSGNPVGDIVHALLVQEHPVPAPIFKTSNHYFRLHNQYRKLFSKLYLQEYIRLTKISREEINEWLLPIAATRLYTKSSLEEKDWTERYIRYTFKNT